MIMMIAAIVQGITGFGFSLVAFPLLALLLPVQVVTPILVLSSLILNVIVFKSVTGIRFKGIRAMTLLAIISTPIGAYILKVISPDILKISVGIVITATALFLLKGYQVKFKRELLARSITGFFSGLLNGTLSMSGPPIILYMSNQGAEKDKLRGSFSLFAMITNVFAIITLYYAGLINSTVFVNFVELIPALIIGVILGVQISRKVNENTFRKITLYLLIAMGISTLILTLVKN